MSAAVQKEALWQESAADGRIRCLLCPHHCLLKEGADGRCRARGVREGRLRSLIYGLVSAAALDPMEKKPFYHFHPGGAIFSVGSWGCNMACPFCQNWEISQLAPGSRARQLTPEELLQAAAGFGGENCGLAFTYMEPLVWFEYVLEAATLAKKRGMVVAMVSNGMIEEEPLRQLLPLVDAWNIDLKAWDAAAYQQLGGNLAAVKRTIELTSASAHVEVTTLLAPRAGVSLAQVPEVVSWLQGLSRSIPWHLTRYHPAWRCREAGPSVAEIEEIWAAAAVLHPYVYIGNMPHAPSERTCCRGCGATLLDRQRRLHWLTPEKSCRNCGKQSDVFGEIHFAAAEST